MSFTVKVVESVTEGSTKINVTNDYIVDTSYKITETIADATTDANYLLAIDVSGLQAFSMVSTQAITVKTNSSGAPQETFTMAANDPVIFQVGDAAIFAGDVTSIFITNASGAAADFTLIAGINGPV